MDCPWRRTLASVFLLLSPHNVRVLSQNVMPINKPLPLLPLPREPCAGLNPGSAQQQMNLHPGYTNGLSECVPLGPYIPDYQRIPEHICGPIHPQALPYNPVSQVNTPPSFPQGPLFNIPQNLPPLHGPSLNILQTPLVPLPQSSSFNSQQLTNIPPLQGLQCLPNILPQTPIPQGSTLNVSPGANLPLPQGISSNISPAPLVPFPQNQMLYGSQAPVGPITGPGLNVPPVTGFQNQNMQIFPFTPTSYPQPYLPLTNSPCTLTTDLTSMYFLPPPNLPSPLPKQNYAPLFQTPIQPVMYPQPIVDYFPNTPVLPNLQISALPPVLPPNTPQQYSNFCVGSQSAGEEYSPVPITLQINVQSPTIPEPKITLISAFPTAPTSPAPTSTADSSNVSFGMFPSDSLPSIIIEKRRSSSRSWLPLVLVALFTRNDGGDGNGCCCCCPSNSGSADIPIPFPIPIPTNNPIILGSSCRSRKRGTKAKRT